MDEDNGITRVAVKLLMLTVLGRKLSGSLKGNCYKGQRVSGRSQRLSDFGENLDSRTVDQSIIRGSYDQLPGIITNDGLLNMPHVQTAQRSSAPKAV